MVGMALRTPPMLLLLVEGGDQGDHRAQPQPRVAASKSAERGVDGEPAQGGDPGVLPGVPEAEPPVPLGGGHYRKWGLSKTARTFGSKWERGSVG